MPGRRIQRHRSRRNVYLEALEQRILFSFGVTTGTTPTGQTTYVIDNGGDLKFSVIKGGTLSSTIHMGDVSSILYKNQEMLATYAQTARYSHYEQGLGSITTINYTVNSTSGWILVACDDSQETTGAVIQYYAVRRNDSTIYMASLPLDVSNGPGEGRFLAYLLRSVFSVPEAPSDNSGTTGAIEGGDVFGHSDGTTTSKFYNMGRRMIDNVYHGLTGTSSGYAVGAWMYMGNRETSSGGPFFKDIDFQSSETQVELYNCLFTGHTQTEAFRQGMKGPYALQFTNGSLPSTPDYTWMDALNLQGWTPAGGRGAITGMATGVPSGHDVVVGLANATAQYWARPDTTGHYTITGLLPGTYTQTLYDTELEVGTRTVTISAGQTTSSDITDTFYIPSAASTVFRIGTWDGTPAGFVNADKISIMHPSDVRMSSWTATPNFVVGTNTDSQWPLAEFRALYNAQRITFTLSAGQVQDLTFRIGITLNFQGARPQITVNSGQSYAWTSYAPPASQGFPISSRGITRGTWRGYNQLYQYSIPASALRAGTNTIDLPLISGTTDSGTYLCATVVFDALDLIYTSASAPPTISAVTVTPTNGTINVGASRSYAAVSKDGSGNTIAANYNWSAARGAITPAGTYVAPATAGADTLTAIAVRTGIPGYTITRTSSSAIAATLTSSGYTPVTVYSLLNRRALFYSGSVFDSGTHEAAIAPDKSALLPGGTAGFANYSSYGRGLNGIIVDIQGTAATLTASSFTFKLGNDNAPAAWGAAPAPLSVVNQTTSGSATRIVITWADGAIVNQWLQVTVKGGAGAASGLPADDVFYFGNTPGEVGNSVTGARVDTIDQITIRYAATASALITAPCDINRDGVIDSADEGVARGNLTYFLNELHLVTPAGALTALSMDTALVAAPTATAAVIAAPAGSGLPVISAQPAVAFGQVFQIADFRRRFRGILMEHGGAVKLVPVW